MVAPVVVRYPTQHTPPVTLPCGGDPTTATGEGGGGERRGLHLGEVSPGHGEVFRRGLGEQGGDVGGGGRGRGGWGAVEVRA